MSFSKKSLFKFGFIAILFLGLIVSWLGFGERGFFHLYRMEQERQAYIEKIHSLERTNQELLEQIERLQKDKEYILLRSRLLVVQIILFSYPTSLFYSYTMQLACLQILLLQYSSTDTKDAIS